MALPLLMLLPLALAGTGDELGVDMGDASALRGCTAVMEVDARDDGIVDWTWLYRWDELGRVVTVIGESSGATPFRARMRYQYGDTGDLARRSWDAGVDGRADAVTVYRYDGGHLVRSDEYTDRDETLRTYAWEEDPVSGPRLVRWTIDRGADGQGVTVAWATWRGDRMVSSETDEDGDGEMDYRSAYEYDPFGHLVRTTLDDGLDGWIDAEDTETWDRAGRLVERTSSRDLGAGLDTRSRLSWSCPTAG